MATKSKKPSLKESYLAELRRRAKESHVYRKYQLMGLEIATALGDEKHKTLYIKLAKEGDADRMLALAKDVAVRGSVKNKGAYFMAILRKEADERIEAAKRKEAAQKAAAGGMAKKNGQKKIK